MLIHIVGRHILLKSKLLFERSIDVTLNEFFIFIKNKEMFIFFKKKIHEEKVSKKKKKNSLQNAPH